MRTSQSLLGQAVILEPSRNADNILQPLTDSVTPLIIRGHSSTQSAPLLRFETDQGVLLSSVDSAGAFTGAAASPSGAVILAPDTIDRNLVQPTADGFHALVLKIHSATQSVNTFEVRDETGAVAVAVRKDGSLLVQPNPTNPFIDNNILKVTPPTAGAQMTYASDGSFEVDNGSINSVGSDFLFYGRHIPAATGRFLQFDDDGFKTRFLVAGTDASIHWSGISAASTSREQAS